MDDEELGTAASAAETDRLVRIASTQIAELHARKDRLVAQRKGIDEEIARIDSVLAGARVARTTTWGRKKEAVVSILREAGRPLSWPELCAAAAPHGVQDDYLRVVVNRLRKRGIVQRVEEEMPDGLPAYGYTLAERS